MENCVANRQGSTLKARLAGYYIKAPNKRDEFRAAFAKADVLTCYTITDGPLDTPCHVWCGRGGQAESGYGGVTYRNQRYYPHRLAWIRAHSQEIPEGMWCLHLCERPLCVNATHMYIGTPQDNALDRDHGTDRQRTEPNMQSLYNCKRIDKDHYRITKFDSGFVPFEHHDGTVSSYTCTERTCDCPQGHKPSCRHRKMLPFFIEQEHVGDNWFFIWDTHQWIKATGVFAEAMEEQLDVPELVNAMEHVGIHTVIVDENSLISETPAGGLFDPAVMESLKEGGHKPASATPSSRPSTYRRMR